MSMVGVYAYALFWVRALQVLLLLVVIPFFLAMGQPVTVLRGGLGAAGRDRVDRLLRSGLLRVLALPFHHIGGDVGQSVVAVSDAVVRRGAGASRNRRAHPSVSVAGRLRLLLYPPANRSRAAQALVVCRDRLLLFAFARVQNCTTWTARTAAIIRTDA